jgi:A/G-specific adenine glycosylase
MAKFPTVGALAAAPLDDVLAAWAGLGYYSRARNLHAGAQAVRDALPRTAADLRTVPGIGPYTAGAIASIAYGERAPLVDGNVARVLARVLAIEDDVKSTAGTKALWTKAGDLMAALPLDARPGDLNQGLMELGATLCSPTSPRCLVCPLAKICIANQTARQDELPVMPARKKTEDLPLLERTLVWIEDAATIVVARRPTDGLYGGLWELPELATAERLGATLDPMPVAYHDQVLTHRRLRITVVRGRGLARTSDPSYDAIKRVPIADVETLGVASATVAILRKYQDSPWTSTKKPLPSSPKATRRSSEASASSASTSPTPTSPRPPRARRKASTSSSTTRRKPAPKSTRSSRRRFPPSTPRW